MIVWVDYQRNWQIDGDKRSETIHKTKQRKDEDEQKHQTTDKIIRTEKITLK